MCPTKQSVSKVVVLCLLVMLGSGAAYAETTRSVAELTVTSDFDPAATEGWLEVSSDHWEKPLDRGVLTLIEGEAAGLHALAGIQDERRALARDQANLTSGQRLRLTHLELAEASFTQALNELRGGHTKSVEDELTGSYCGGYYELKTELLDFGFGFPGARAKAKVLYFPFGPTSPIDPTIRYTFTKTWVWDPVSGRQTPPANDLQYVESIGYTESNSQSMLFSPIECIANAEAYYVTYNSQTCATSIIGASIRLWQNCDTF